MLVYQRVNQRNHPFLGGPMVRAIIPKISSSSSSSCFLTELCFEKVIHLTISIYIPWIIPSYIPMKYMKYHHEISAALLLFVVVFHRGFDYVMFGEETVTISIVLFIILYIPSYCILVNHIRFLYPHLDSKTYLGAPHRRYPLAN